MAPKLFYYNNSIDTNLISWQISVGLIVFLWCALFFGLKLKWFRAQLRMGQTSNEFSTPVMGVGYKLRSNVDDIQVYKVTSEFTPTPNEQITKPQTIRKEIISNPSNPQTIQSSSNISIKHKEAIIKKQISIRENNHNLQPKQDTRKIEQKPKERKSSNTSKKEKSFSELTKSQLKVHQKNQEIKHPKIENKNPLVVKNIVMPVESEDVWKTKKVEDGKIEENDLYFTASNSGLYSSQAASIFFGGQEAAPLPRARKFVEMEEDNLSVGSQTSA